MTYSVEQDSNTSLFHVVTIIGGVRFVSEKGYVHEKRANGVAAKL